MLNSFNIFVWVVRHVCHREMALCDRGQQTSFSEVGRRAFSAQDDCRKMDLMACHRDLRASANALVVKAWHSNLWWASVSALVLEACRRKVALGTCHSQV